MTILSIILAALVALNIWLALITVKWEKSRRRKLQERMDEYEEYSERLLAECEQHKHRLVDALSEVAHLRKMYNMTKAELEKLKSDGSGKRPVKKHRVKSSGGGTGEKRKG